MTAIEKLQKQLGADEAALITSETNRMYFTRFPSSDGFLFVTKEEAVFATDSRYIEAAEAQAQGCKVLESNGYARLGEIAGKAGKKRVLLEAERVTLALHSYLKEKLGRAELDASDRLDRIITDLREIKSEEEKNLIIKAQRIAEKAFLHILGFIKPGVTEKEIGLELDYFMLRNGADALSFETIAVSGKNSSMPHGVPTDKRVENGDFITMDFGAVCEGWHSDMTRTVAVGSVSEKQRTVYETVLKAQEASLKAVRSGVTGKKADAAARDIIAAAGWGANFGHGTGHGVGVEIHESPRLSPAYDKELRAGQIVTVEPGIYLPGEFGVRIEDMAFVTENGCENLTAAPKELIIL